jgi:hypothetical protein
VFELIRSWPTTISAVLCAFDLLEVDGEDWRRSPIEMRKAGLAMLLHKPSPGIALNAHYVGDGAIVYQQATSSAMFEVNRAVGMGRGSSIDRKYGHGCQSKYGRGCESSDDY